MSKLIDLTGQRFGRLTVIERVENAPNRARQWLCLCDCGKETIVVSSSLNSGRTRSCGCLSIQKASERIVSLSTTHGRSKTRLYSIWCGMKNRCKNTTHQAYSNYGGRGITVCEDWLNDFNAFYDWAMENGYQDDLSIDRTDNDKGYSPENCRWRTAKEQNQNKSTNMVLEIDGVSKPLPTWCDEYNIKRRTVQDRLDRGWTPEEALGLIPRRK